MDYYKPIVGLFITCKIFSDDRFPPALLLPPLPPHHGRDALVEADPLVRGLGVCSIGIVSSVLSTGVGVTVISQILATLNQFLIEKSSGEDEKGLSENSVE